MGHRKPLRHFNEYFGEATVSQVFRGLFDQWTISTIADQISGKEEVNCVTYIIKQDDYNFYKIGKTNDITNRCAQLQTGNPFELKIITTLKGDYEQVLHYCLRNYRYRGEWFKVQRPLLILLIKFMEQAVLNNLDINAIAMSIFDL